MNRPLLIACALLLPASLAVAAPVAVVSLSVTPDHMLLGLTPLLTITVTNHGTEPLTLTGVAKLSCVAPDGSRFLAITGPENPNVGMFAPANSPELALAPATSRTYYARGGPFSETVFFGDPHFRTPGRYLIHIELFADDDAATVFTSNDVVVTMEQPRGVDANVWALLSAAVGDLAGEPMAAAFVDQSIPETALSQYPQSRYMPYLVPHYRTRNFGVRERLLKTAIAQPLPENFSTELKLLLLDAYAHHTTGSLVDFKLDEALTYQVKTQRLATELQRSQFPFASTEATAVLKKLPTPAELRSTLKWEIQQAAPASSPVSPFVQCVDPGLTKDDPIIVVFGYDSSNRIGRYVPVGSDNRLRPDDASATLPTYLAPGHNLRKVFAVAAHGTDITWTLDGRTAAVTPATPRCTAPASAGSVIPLLDCVTASDDDKLTATFGYNSPNTDPLRLPAGPLNHAGPKGDTPTVFLPGEHRGVLTVQGKNGVPPAWTLQGRTLTASSASLHCSNEAEGDN